MKKVLLIALILISSINLYSQTRSNIANITIQSSGSGNGFKHTTILKVNYNYLSKGV